MESHIDDNDIDPPNDEELPPGSSTKEPKSSFTTAQVRTSFGDLAAPQIFGKYLSVPSEKVHLGLV